MTAIKWKTGKLKSTFEKRKQESDNIKKVSDRIPIVVQNTQKAH